MTLPLAAAMPARVPQSPHDAPTALPSTLATTRSKPAPAPPPAPPEPKPHPARVLHHGLSLRPTDAVDPYQFGVLVPDRVGIDCLTLWCPTCRHSLEVVEYKSTQRGTLAKGVCHFCSNLGGDKPGIYRWLLIPMEFVALPDEK